MKTVNIGTLKNHLSTYLKHVQAGEEVIVHDRKKPVARIVPMAASGLEDEEGHLVASGQMRLPQEEIDWSQFARLPLPAVSDQAVRDALDWAKGN